MRAICRYNRREQVLLDFPKVHWLTSIQFFDVPLEIGEEYAVGAVQMFNDVLLFLVADRWGHPIPAPAALFELVDGTVPDHWVFHMRQPLSGIDGDDPYPLIAMWAIPRSPTRRTWAHSSKVTQWLALSFSTEIARSK